MDAVNLLDTPAEYNENDPLGYHSGDANIGRMAGGRETNIKMFELPRGQSGSPYHYEYVEEWLLVLSGEVDLRLPDGDRSARTGDLICFPAGPAGAHKVTGRGETPARVLMFSSSREPAVAVYPDSDKIGVWPGNEADNLVLRRADGGVDYWDGEA